MKSPKPSSRLLLLLLGALLASACVDPVVEGERPCPCAIGWTCCADVQLCVSDAARCEQLRPPPAEPTAPSAPRSLTATTEVGAVGLAWFEPEKNGGAALTGYDVKADPVELGLSVRVDGHTARVEGLRAGATYRFTVIARNAVGPGPAATTGPVRLPDVPAAPAAPIAEREDRAARVTWEAPPSDGGLPVLRYMVTAHPGNAAVQVAAPALSARVEGLTNGVPLAFTVRAVNAVGWGPESTASASVMPAGPPRAPGALSVTPAVRAMSVTWEAPADTGGLPLSGYVVTLWPGEVSRQVDAATTTATFTGLENNTGYSFRVVPYSEVGEGIAAYSLSTITPALPSAPASVQATPDVRSIVVAWEPPASDGREPLTGYTVVAQPLGLSVEVGPDASGVTLQSVPSTQAQTITVTARNAVGQSPATAAAKPVRPHPAPVEVTQLEVPAEEGGCRSVAYALRQVDGVRADVVVEVDAAGDGTFTRATQAGSATHSGMGMLTTSAAGTAHAFHWNRARDIPGAAPSTRVRVTATVPGTPSSTRTESLVLATTTRRCGLDLDSSPVRWATEIPSWPATELTHGDFNRDGKQDLVVLHFGDYGTSFLRGRGDGSFEPPAQAAASTLNGTALASADVDGDGELDLVTVSASFMSTLVRVARGRGNGTFEDPVFTWLRTLTNAFSPMPLLLRDLDGDGAPEVIVAQANTLFVLRHTGGGNLTVAFEKDVGAQDLLVGGDFNGDGREDLVMMGRSLHAFYGLGSLSFRVEALGPVGDAVSAVKAADFNGDGHLDLAAVVTDTEVEDGETSLQLRLGDRDGRFGAPTRLLQHDSGSWGKAAQLTVGDLDADGDADLAYLNADWDAVKVLSGRGDGTFESRDLPCGRYQDRIDAADFDGSGRLDLVVLSLSRNVRVLRNLEETARGAPGAVPVAGDFDGDGWDDVASLADGGVQVHLTRATGGLVRRGPSALPAGSTWKLLPGRFDAGPTVDLLVQVQSLGPPPFSRSLVLLRGNGDGTFAAAEPLPVGGDPLEAVAGDVDGDGDLDVVCSTSRTEDGFSFYEVRLLRSNGDGTYAPGVLLSSQSSGTGLAMGDLNTDGRADLVVLRNVSSQFELILFEGRADGTLPRVTEYSPPSQPCYGAQLVVEDFNHDGHMDVVVSCNGGERNGVLALWGASRLGFSTRNFYSTTDGAGGLAVRDLDGDGWRDLVTTIPGSEAVCVFRSKARPGGEFEPAACFGTVAFASSVSMLDVEHDGVLELLVGGGYYEGSTLLRQR